LGIKLSIYIIGEIGINHNGDMNIIKDLIDISSEAGANAVKFQKRTIEKVYTKELLDSDRESPWGNTQREQKEGLELSKEDFLEIDKYCKKKNIDWFASAWDIESQKFLQDFSLPRNKIASAMLVCTELLEEVASEGIHTFISTGLSSMEDISNAVNIFRKSNCPFELMHCVSTYPMEVEDANLNCINTLRNEFKCDVGYSGHETGLAVSYAATALGITSLERHITLDKSMYGSDQAASIEPGDFRSLVRAVRAIEKSMGNGKKVILDAEKEIAQKLRAHL
tara:strand:+ start:8485 stop:9327 length:843 start_codon:yes stop_codon:yes gene_type:complete